MKHARPAVFLAAAAAICAVALPSQAAVAKSRTVYFDDQGTASGATCKTNFVLTKTAPAKPTTYCGDAIVANGGKGYTRTDDYVGVPTASGFKLDSSRKLTGTVYIGTYPPVTVGLGVASTPEYTGGPIGVDIVVTVNGVALPTVSASGTEAPNTAFAVPVSVKLPASLNGKLIKSIDTKVTYTQGVSYVGGVSRDPGAQSKLVFPTR
jgi:hypothetical protein